MLALVALAELLGMTLWFSATAVAAPVAAELHLSQRSAAWLTMAVQAGFVVGTLASGLFNLPDRLNARRLFALGAVAGAASERRRRRSPLPRSAPCSGGLQPEPRSRACIRRA